MASSAPFPPGGKAGGRDLVRARGILVAVTTEKLVQLADLFDAGRLRTNVGQVLGLSDARRAHGTIENGTAPPGKSVLVP